MRPSDNYDDNYDCDYDKTKADDDDDDDVKAELPGIEPPPPAELQGYYDDDNTHM